MSNLEHKVSIRKSSVQIQEPTQSPETNSILPSSTTDHENDLLDLEPANDSQMKQYGTFLKDRVVTIEGPELVTQNVIKSYKLYKVKTRKRDQQEYDTVVSRRFSDFQYLQTELIQVYGGCIIPLLPEKNFWANLNMQGQKQIQRRVKGLQKYLRGLLSHQKISTGEQLRRFLFGDEGKFFEKKGQYASTLKTEQTIKSFAQNAYTISKDFISNLIQKQTNKQQQNNKCLLKPSIDDIKIMEYQKEITDLLKVIDVLAKVVQNSVMEMRCVGQLFGEQVDQKNVLNQFEEISKYIFSCNAALTRRMQVRLQIDQLTIQLEAWQKKSQSNPRSQQLDILRSKLARANEKCKIWTTDLLGELVRSISTGKSMIEGFIEGYVSTKASFYEK